ncbi:MAG: hypothetical protein ACQR33_04225 [Candidatus Saccharibacteria bacterium]
MKYFLGFLASIGLIVLTVILIVRGFSGHAPKNVPAPLLDYANTSVEMQYTIDGPINADQAHKALRVTIGQDSTKIEELTGYSQTVADGKMYENNQDSYAAFLRALDIAGYTKGNTASDQKDERGYCPAGYRYSFDIVDGGDVKQHFWSTSCGQGTFKGKTTQVINLFQQQIPDYGTGNFTINS